MTRRIFAKKPRWRTVLVSYIIGMLIACLLIGIVGFAFALWLLLAY